MLSFLRPRSDSGNGSHRTMSHKTGAILEDARERTALTGAEVRKQFGDGDVEELLKTWIRTRPGLSLGAAFAAGVVIGWLIKRR
jgi:ElaB/YqjD/DUF883 family membrane-anchored ribosome-binding protein